MESFRSLALECTICWRLLQTFRIALRKFPLAPYLLTGFFYHKSMLNFLLWFSASMEKTMCFFPFILNRHRLISECLKWNLNLVLLCSLRIYSGSLPPRVREADLGFSLPLLLWLILLDVYVPTTWVWHCELVSILPLLFRETVAEDTNSYLFPGRICWWSHLGLECYFWTQFLWQLFRLCHSHLLILVSCVFLRISLSQLNFQVCPSEYSIFL